MISIALQKMVTCEQGFREDYDHFDQFEIISCSLWAHLASCQRPLLGHDRLFQRLDCCLDLQQLSRLSCFSRRIYWAQTDNRCRGIYNVDKNLLQFDNCLCLLFFKLLFCFTHLRAKNGIFRTTSIILLSQWISKWSCTSSTRFLKALSVCSQLVRRFEATWSRVCLKDV